MINKYYRPIKPIQMVQLAMTLPIRKGYRVQNPRTTYIYFCHYLHIHLASAPLNKLFFIPNYFKTSRPIRK